MNRINIIRDPYRSLLNNGRTYAAFEKTTTLPLIEKLSHHKIIADPMAGYGSLMNFCAEKNIPTFNIEYNPPSYLWIVATNPNNSDAIINIINIVEKKNLKFLEIEKHADISSSWFSERSKEIVIRLFELICNAAKNCIERPKQEEVSLAILLPFVGRLSSHVPGNIVSHVKEGGICVYNNLKEDFKCYLLCLKNKLIGIRNNSNKEQHDVVFGDLRTIKLETTVSAFITSPPYPNGRDYHKMFGPENDCILFMRENRIIDGMLIIEELISSPIVSKFKNNYVDIIEKISSNTAKRFIKQIENFRGSKQAKYDNEVYYIPYFSNYFYQIQKAYQNFINCLEKNCEGYIVVVNNTARNKVIPVAESIVDVFNSFGFETKICENLTRELFHFGSINPRAKGFRAKHMEYVINVRRGRKV